VKLGPQNGFWAGFVEELPPPPLPPPSPETLLQRAGRLAKAVGMLVIETPEGLYAICAKNEYGSRWPNSGGVSIEEVIRALKRKIAGEW